MATRSRRLTEDDNFSVHFDGGVKTNGSSVGKNKRGRKAQNGISNSAALQASRKSNRNNVIIPIVEDKKAQIPKAQISGKKVQVSGRKEAPGDLPEPECVKLFREYLDFMKSIADAEDKIENIKKSIADDIAQEGFLHNHEECLKSQGISILGLDEGNVQGLGDISNSAALQASRKYNTKNVIIPIGEDKKAQIPKAQISGKKVQVSGRKAPCDLPECVKLFRECLDLKKSIAEAEGIVKNFKKSIPDADEDPPDDIAQGGFLHNDEEYMTSQERTMHDMISILGLDEDRFV